MGKKRQLAVGVIRWTPTANGKGCLMERVITGISQAILLLVALAIVFGLLDILLYEITWLYKFVKRHLRREPPIQRFFPIKPRVPDADGSDAERWW
jgi:hypothetical protein